MASTASNDPAPLDPRWHRAIQSLGSGDKRTALSLYRALADDGDRVALVEVGNLYELGALGTPDYEEAAKWYRRAVHELGDPKAHLALARLHFNGQLGSDARPEAFRRHASLAAEHEEPLGSLMLGLAHETGHLCEKDEGKASRYYESAASAGMVVAQKRLAAMALRARRPLEATRLILKALVATVALAVRDPKDRRLAGLRKGERR